MEIEMKEVRRPLWKATLRDKDRIQVVEHSCDVWHPQGGEGRKDEAGEMDSGWIIDSLPESM